MKTYVCDSCKKIMGNPYTVRMKEFYVGCHFDLGTVFPTNTSYTKKVHLCQTCWKNLSRLFDGETPEKSTVKFRPPVGVDSDK